MVVLLFQSTLEDQHNPIVFQFRLCYYTRVLFEIRFYIQPEVKVENQSIYNPFLIVRVRLDGLVGFEVVLSRSIFGEKSESDLLRTKSSPKVTFNGSSFDGDDGPPGGGGELRPSSCCSSLCIPSP